VGPWRTVDPLTPVKGKAKGEASYVDFLEALGRTADLMSLPVGPARCRSPRHRMPFNSRHEGSKSVQMSRRVSLREILLATSWDAI
jgi:hypothetical protein